MKYQRILYVSAGRADLLASHRSWRAGSSNPDQVSLTFSGQIESFAESIGATCFLISDHPSAEKIEDGSIIVEHRPKKTGSGIGYYRAELAWCLGIIATARRFRAGLALIDSGSIPFFMMSLFRFAGIEVVPILHNALWPSGSKPKSRGKRIIRKLDAVFFRFLPKAVVAVSPEVRRQVTKLAGARHPPVYEIRAQFDRAGFAAIPPPDISAKPFNVIFVGRAIVEKGVLDIPIMAQRIEREAPGSVRWTMCGAGPDLDIVRAEIARLGLGSIVEVRGWTSPSELRLLYAKMHASIVPTRSGIGEGLAMTAAESILAGRPLVTNPVVPALEILAPAAIAAKPDDPISHAEAVMSLSNDHGLYNRLQAACVDVSEQFYDRDQGLTEALRRVVTD